MTNVWSYLGGSTAPYNGEEPATQTSPAMWSNQTHIWVFGGTMSDGSGTFIFIVIILLSIIILFE